MIKSEENDTGSVFDTFLAIGLVLSLFMVFVFAPIGRVDMTLLPVGGFLIIVGLVAFRSTNKTISVIHGIPFLHISIIGILVDAYAINRIYLHYQISEKTYWLIIILQVLILGITLLLFPYICYVDDRKYCTELVSAKCTRVEKNWKQDSNTRNYKTYTPIFDYEYCGETYEYYRKQSIASGWISRREYAYSLLGKKKKIWVNPSNPAHACDETFCGRGIMLIGAMILIFSMIVLILILNE